MSRDFFKLLCNVPDVDQNEFYERVHKDDIVAHFIYRPDALDPNGIWNRHKIKDKKIWNVSLSKTEVKNIEFTNCRFEYCLFIGTIFKNCRFTNCTFYSCNVHRIEFEECFVNPDAFRNCIERPGFDNIGVYLYQELLRNSLNQSQTEFSDNAQRELFRWRRKLLRYSGEKNRGLWGNCANDLAIFGLWIFDLTSCSGTSLRRFALSAAGVIGAFSFINWNWASALGLKAGDRAVSGFSEMAYLTLATSLGFGDLTPETLVGRGVIGLELALGFSLFALLTSMIFRRIVA